MQKQSLSKFTTSQHQVNIFLCQDKFPHRAHVTFSLHSAWRHFQSFWGPETLSHDLTFATGRQQSLLTQPQEVCCQGNREGSFKSYALILLLKTDLTEVFFWNMMQEPRCLLPSAMHCIGMIYACTRVTVVEEDVGPIWKWYKLFLYKMLMLCRSARSKLLSASRFQRAALHQAESKWNLTDFLSHIITGLFIHILQNLTFYIMQGLC